MTVAGDMSHVSAQVGRAETGCCPRVSTPTRDAIRINDMKIMIPFSAGAPWPTKEPAIQPVSISLTMLHDLRETAQSDDVSHSIDYSEVLTTLATFSSQAYSSLETLSDRIFGCCFAHHPALTKMCLKISLPKALLHARTAGIESERARAATHPEREKLFIEDLECSTIVGVNPCEREEKQHVCFNISLSRATRRDIPFDFRGIAHQVLDRVQGSSCLTLEALTSLVARTVLLSAGQCGDSVTIRGAKPSALTLADSAEVEIMRTFSDYQPPAVPASTHLGVDTTPETPSAPPTFSALVSSVPDQFDFPVSFKHRAAIAVGANLGDRFANIELALRLLEAPENALNGSGPPKAVVVDTSFMYETAPMYVTDQPKFINCACLIETDMGPVELLSFLKEIESAVGRVTSFRNGPRAIDLDVLIYDSMVIDTRPAADRDTLDNLTGELVVPHPRIAEREFVLRPLNDMIPDYIHPILGKPVQTLLTELTQRQPSDTPAMSKVMPWPRYPLPEKPLLSPAHITPVPPTATYWSFPIAAHAPRKTYIMGTLNATPDSFSDGAQHNSLPAALAYAVSSVAAGADIIDVGGYSTRPHAAFVSPEEELARVVPVIEAIRALRAPDSDQRTMAADVLLSVDTFRWEVAAAAVHAGANCINDVYAFAGPAYPPDRTAAAHFVQMRRVARGLAVPVVLMHSRGDASANKDYSAYAYAADARGRGAVVEAVRAELGERVNAAVKCRGGLRRWLVAVDPGIGFSKTVEGNLELLRTAAAVVSDCRPPAAGSSMRRNPLAGFPQLIGTSRKSFLGTLLKSPDTEGAYKGRETRPDERGWATAAAVSCAVQQQAAIIRVHDVLQLGDVIRVASSLWP
ncbi:Dihydropteroate synthase [Amylocystis lapponica]|nr:Dihydropteroate synthase [Amylocystis lapponica]